MNASRILIVDDEPDMRWVIKGLFDDAGYEFAEAGNGREGILTVESWRPDVVLTDVVMPDVDGQELLRQCQRLDAELPVILISAVEDIDVAVAAMKEGAFDYMAKPFDSERVRMTTRRAIEQRRLRQEVAQLKGRLRQSEIRFGTSGPAREVERMVALVAPQASVSVLLTGESGTGKEVVAREIHRRSPVAAGPFVAVDCGALPEPLMESQLFGHKKGAFTGADRDRPGLFRMAEGGTLFLDELGNLPLNLQAKLLRVLQERAVAPVGGGEPVPFHARLVAATNSSLPAAIASGAFRLDLYHRIEEFQIELPPLRQRRDDIPYFAELFLAEANHDMGRRVARIAAPALELLRSHNWPGNLRQLRNAIRRALVVCTDIELAVGDLHLAPGAAVEVAAGNSTLGADDDLSLAERIRRATDALEAQMIQAALHQASGNKAAAARALHVDYTTLHRKLKKHGLLTMAPRP